MAKTNPGNTEKNLISRRTLLSNSLLTGLSVATGFYLTNPSNFTYTKANGSGLKNGSNNYLTKSGKKSEEDTYIDNFDC
jgi:hypothetical protein